eukprot:2348671-Pleurochrysis_carterae.AAC.1
MRACDETDVLLREGTKPERVQREGRGRGRGRGRRRGRRRTRKRARTSTSASVERTVFKSRSTSFDLACATGARRRRH